MSILWNALVSVPLLEDLNLYIYISMLILIHIYIKVCLIINYVLHDIPPDREATTPSERFPCCQTLHNTTCVTVCLSVCMLHVCPHPQHAGLWLARGWVPHTFRSYVLDGGLIYVCWQCDKDPSLVTQFPVLSTRHLWIWHFMLVPSKCGQTSKSLMKL